MKRRLLRNSFLTGLVTILPLVLFFILFQWIFTFLYGWLGPLSHFFSQFFIPLGKVLQKWFWVKQIYLIQIIQNFFAFLLSLLTVMLLCILIGWGVNTKLGRLFHQFLEKHVLRFAVGYRTIKRVVGQFFDKENSPFSTVVLVQPFGVKAQVRMLGFVTDTSEFEINGRRFYTVYAPTAPNPTSGYPFIVPAECVEFVDIPVQKAMECILACGAGSADFLRFIA
ncbi:DUF502 domain-containing protein [Candidatus Parcubacteria bacterium]|nr:MAG: DUF502 domain-containing protein [Candidatus Parcubacteria bacterium]